ncbi:MAG: hypothetical protein J2P37_13980 [Ktedonobacteraceae bacterium]|nr:hypothetical protein [Ktedonobacteraceae bacterium]MBO0793923.1 hypothetical protein [Ktedonobacteraceae bacterium]
MKTLHIAYQNTIHIVRLLMVGVGLLLALSSCTFPGLISTSQQLPVVSQQQAQPKLPPVHFPQDEGAHNNLTEWWYYTGHLEARDANGQARRYGFELVVFQILRSNLPPVYISHFAISDITRSQFHYDQRRAIEPTPTPDGNSTKGIDVHVGDWSIQGLNGQDHLVAAMQDYAIDLRLSDLKQPVLHNGNGLITYGLAGFSYYYSRTHMNISGSLTDHGQQLTISGLAWMDHQWGDFLTLGGSGWDWYSIQLDNHTELMLYFIRNDAGQVISTYAGYIDARGNDHLVNAQSLVVRTLGRWRSPVTGISYPSGWHVTINDPQIQATLTLTPQLKNQELVTQQSTGNIYWEGAVTIEGKSGGTSLSGQGYVELTGYHT